MAAFPVATFSVSERHVLATTPKQTTRQGKPQRKGRTRSPAHPLFGLPDSRKEFEPPGQPGSCGPTMQLRGQATDLWARLTETLGRRRVDGERGEVSLARLVCWDQRVGKFLAQTRQNSSPKSAPRNGLASLSTSHSNRVVDQIEDGRTDLRGPDWQPPAYPETAKVIAITQTQQSQRFQRRLSISPVYGKATCWRPFVSESKVFGRRLAA